MTVQRRHFIQSIILSGGALSLSSIFDQVNEKLCSIATREGYSLDSNIYYLNHASIGTCPIDVQAAFKAYIEKCEENPARYIWGLEWDEARTKVRAQLATFLNCAPDELAITHNTTEGFNQIAQGLDIGQGDEVVYSNLNHAGASICFDHYSKSRAYTVRKIETPLEDAIHWSQADCVDFYTSRLTEKTKLLVLPHIDNMIGYRHDVRAIAHKARQLGVKYIAVDAAQSIGMIPVDLDNLGVDFYCGSPHKWLQSPKGLGLFYVRKEIQPSCAPMWVTWGQNRWKETAQIYEDYGTRDLPTVLALGHALQYHQNVSWKERTQAYKQLRVQAQSLCSSKIKWHAPKDWRNGSGLYSVKVDKDCNEIATRLSQQGYIVRGFSQGFIRISPNLMNTSAEIEKLFESINKLI